MKSHRKNLIYWPSILLGYGGLLSLGILDTIRGPFLPAIIEDLKLSQTKGSFLFVVPSSLAMIGSTFSGVFAKRLGVPRTLQMGLFFMAIGFFILSQITSLFGLITAAVFFGFGLGIVNVLQNIAVSDGANAEHRRRFLSGLHSIYGLAALSAPVIAATIQTLGLSWRDAFLYSLLPLFFVFVYGFFVKKVNSKSEATEVTHLSPWQTFRRTWIWSLILGLYLWLELGLCTRLVLYCQKELQWSAQEAQTVLFVFFLALLIGRLVFALVRVAH